MRIGITICAVALIQLIYLYFGGVIDGSYIAGNFIGGLIIAFVEIVVFQEVHK